MYQNASMPGIASAQLTQAYADGVNAPARQTIANALLSEMDGLCKRAANILAQQNNIAVRIFGPEPLSESLGQKSAPTQGVFAEVGNQIEALKGIFCAIENGLIKLEKIA